VPSGRALVLGGQAEQEVAARCYYLLSVYYERIVLGMSVPMTLLGLLEREPSHGYDLKRDYDAYFGRGKPLSFGQLVGRGRQRERRPGRGRRGT
jgi:hypothetical protein